MKKLVLYSLAIEVTRQCNLRCAHCMRGSVQPKKLNLDHLRTLLKSVDYVTDLTLTGGEPFLQPKLMMDILDTIGSHGITVNHITVITNGCLSKAQRRHIIPFVEKASRIANNWDDVKPVEILLSNDYFHYEEIYNRQQEENLGETLRLLNLLKCFDMKYRNDKYSIRGGTMHNVDFMIPRAVQGLGRATSIRSIPNATEVMPVREVSNQLELEEYDDSSYCTDSTVTLTVDGDLLTDCDYSYSGTDSLKAMHVDELEVFIQNKEEYDGRAGQE